MFANYGRYYARVPNDLAARALSSDALLTADYFDADLTRPIPDGTVTTNALTGAETTTHYRLLGGSSDDQLWAIAVSPDESRVVAVGRTLGIGVAGEVSDFPYLRPLLPFGGGADATLVALAGGTVIAATAWGGDALDSAYDVARAPSGDFVVVGETESSDFPLLEPVHPGGDTGRASGPHGLSI